MAHDSSSACIMHPALSRLHPALFRAPFPREKPPFCASLNAEIAGALVEKFFELRRVKSPTITDGLTDRA